MTQQRQGTVRGVLRGLVVALAASLVPALAAPTVASAAGPSDRLVVINPVPVDPQPRLPRDQDQASRNAMSGEQQSRGVHKGSDTLSATSLAPSSTWAVSGHTGDFSWSYPLRVPPATGDLLPNLALSYRSSAVDGRTSTTNNQPSWIGDGWDLWPGFVERSYGSCVEDGVPNKGDLCWRSDNATAAYGGSGGMLICCDGDQRWRAKADDGARIERRTGIGNGDNDGEHWKITTTDGTQYWFGSQLDSQSTWTVPVFGDDAGEPCHGTSYDNSHCVQAYRWNLDKIVDRNGNVIRYFYETEANHYGLNVKDTAVHYIRAGSLHHIDYGLHESVGGQASGRVDFTTADRCVPGSVCTHDKKDNWPDTALSQKCDASPCKDKYSPSFWSTKRLASVTTNILKDGRYQPVDRWDLDQQFPNPGDGEKPGLWLKSIKHTGLVGGSIELPMVTFEGEQRPNRVYSINDGYAMLNRYRITGVISESGGVISVNYAPTDCKPGGLPVSELNNEMRCFPVRWAAPGHEPRVDYFHKYVVERIVQSDWLSSSTEQITSYEYLDGAAWHWDTSEFAKDDKKTWNEFRGFKRVRIRSGRPAEQDPGRNPMTMTEQRFYRGMHNDRAAKDDPGKRRPFEVADSRGGKRADEDWLEGFSYETTTFDREAPSFLPGSPPVPAPSPPVVSTSITDPVWQGPNATRGEYKSYLVSAGTQRGFTALKSGAWRETKSSTTYDNRGLPKEVNDLGDTATAGDDRCSTTAYAGDESTWQLDRPRTAQILGVACGATPSLSADGIAASRFSYDGKGNLEKTEVAKKWTILDNPEYMVRGTAKYDAHGRATETTNAIGATSRVEYTPRTGGPVTAVKTTSPATPTLPNGLVATTTLEPSFGAPTAVIDANDRRTDITYDALGRTTKVWLPNRAKDDNPIPSVEYSYLIRREAPTVITTTKIGPNGVPNSSKTLYDGLFRPRQLQTDGVGMRNVSGDKWISVDEGRLIVDTRYDTHGRPYKTTQPYYNNGAVDTNFWIASDTEVPGLTKTKFDGAGRATELIYQEGAFDKWVTKTAYEGDRVHTTPRAGGTATTMISDARGQTTELRQYHGPKPEGSHDSTRYKYTKGGHLAEVTAPDGARWLYTYDQRGRRISMEDPDAGVTTLGYNDLDQLTSTRDARGATVVVAYDALGRKTVSRKDSITGPKLAEWTYDSARAGKGMPASSTRYVGSIPYTATVDSYTALNIPLSSTVTIPSAEGVLAGTYTTSFGYGADGSLTGERYPGVGTQGQGGLPEETVNYRLDDGGRPMTTTAPGVQLVANTFYTRYGEVERLEHGTVGQRAWQTFYYETGTRRLERSIVDAEVPRPMQTDTRYTYDPAGNITSIADFAPDKPDIQCLRHDHLRRLTDAWTPGPQTWDKAKGGCTAAPDQNSLSGPAPYWHSYTYDVSGNRRTETQRTTATAATRTYDYPATDQPQPHTLRSVTGPAGTETFEYNPAGATTRRIKPGTDETYTWDVEGHLESVVNTVTNKTTSFVYTADGSRLIRRDSTGTTLYLPGQEVLLPASGGKPVVTRYYAHGGKTVAMRQGSAALTWLTDDHQGTAQVSINSATMQVTRRRQLPFGAPRGGPVAWPDERGFVGGTMDSSTELTHLGAREYDPTTGRFISVDPIMNPGDPQQMHGYTYSNNNPTTFSDPSGLFCDGCYTPDNPNSCFGPNPGSQCGEGRQPWGGNDGQGGGGGGPAGGGSSGGGKSSGKDKLKQPAVKTNPPTKHEIAYFRALGYKGSDLYTYEDALNWAIERPEGFTHYCQLVEGLSTEECRKYLPKEPTFADLAHGLLDIAGVAPGLWGISADVLNGVLYAIEGNDKDAVISFMSLVPMGDAAKLSRSARCSFTGDTQVLMADGSTKPISEIKVGDQVIAADPETGENGARTVTAVMVHEDTVVELLTGTGAKVSTTEDHPFYNATDKKWQRADELDRGDSLLTAAGDRIGVMGLLGGTTRSADAYNLTVDDLHTYHVVVGSAPVLVHNSCPAFKPGEIYYDSVRLSDGREYEFAALNVRKAGDDLILDDVIVSPIGNVNWNDNRGVLGVAGAMELRRLLRDEYGQQAARQGYKAIVLNFTRSTGNPGHVGTIRIPLE